MSDYEASTGDLSTQHVLKSFTYTEPRWSEDAGSEASTSMNVTSFTQAGNGFGGPWFVCPVCLREFPQSDGIEIDGKLYCDKDAGDVIHDKNTRGG